MYNYKSRIGILILIASVLAIIQADDQKLKISGWGFLTYGRIINSQVQKGKDFDVKGQNYSDFDAGLKCVYNLGENSKGRFHIGLTTAFMMVDNQNKNVELKRRRFVPYLIDAAIEHTFKFGNNTIFNEFGYLPVKYNPEARNLGEYLFRSNCYPNLVISGFELADKEKMVGWHGMYKNDFTEKSWIKGDVFCNVELGLYPLYDISLAYILSTNIFSFIELGAGLYHQHLISVDEKKIKPGIDRKRWPRNTDEFLVTGYISPEDDTMLYTFKGTKAMGRVTLDPKAFFNVPIFGSEDLKIYGEMAILGIKNYDYWYDDITERMPLMFGFNFPTFKILDVLAFEAQYWTYPWWNSAENIWKYGSPVPYCGSQGNDGQIPYFSEADTLRKHNDDWRWSIYASRKIANRVRISLQFASDNLNKTVWNPPPPSYTKYTEALPRTKDWYWVSRITFYL